MRHLEVCPVCKSDYSGILGDSGVLFSPARLRTEAGMEAPLLHKLVRAVSLSQHAGAAPASLWEYQRGGSFCTQFLHSIYLLFLFFLLQK